MLLYEVFQNVMPYSWTEESAGVYEAQFMVNDNLYVVQFYKKTPKRGMLGIISSPPFWYFEFKLLNTPTQQYGITGAGNAGTVFGTVMAIANEFIRKVKPKIIKFEAEEPSRQKLYTTMIQRLKQPYWKVKQEMNSGYKIFTVKIA